MDWDRQDAERAAQDWWYETKQEPSWGSLSPARRKALTDFAAGILDGTGRRERKALWRALHRHYDATPRRGSLESMGYSGTGRFHAAHHAVMAFDNGDGTDMKQLLEARFSDQSRGLRPPDPEGRPVEIKVVAQWVDHHDSFWQGQLAQRERAFVAGGKHYRHNGWRSGAADMRGFGGAAFTIFFNDGRIVHTNDLWFQGEIPPKYREQLPDDAVLVSGRHDTRPDQPAFDGPVKMEV